MIDNHDNAVLEGRKHSAGQPEKNVISDTTDEDIFFAKERYNLHQSSPEEGVDTDILKKYFSKKYGF